MNIENKKILIVGGTSGFGLEIAKLALQNNATVTIIGRDKDRLEEALQSLKLVNTSVTGYIVEATNVNQLNYFFEQNGSFDHVVSMLGGAMDGGFLDNTVENIEKIVKGKFFNNLQLAQIAKKHLNKKGSIILTAGSGGSPATASGAYVGNHAIDQLVQGLALELAPDYRVNAVSPTWTPTGLWRDMDDHDKDEQIKSFSDAVPLKRLGSLQEVGSGYLYLMSNDFITGQTMHIDGGIDLR
ncbi:SDR family oxidoreductase [Weissella paramesenteroides]|uniref:SDR family oxidoreductase n=1 Tax=Weissella paramesenteroides TaxID=1249 RepID=A0ABD4XKZ4_WEIPA|nr:SDR family oxidoreductase [Weissella paramesenteroides]MDF8369948.1 SDR family oxidoreductase [Weissella paramesenteroides]MDF8371969.1 SDR family oxidoreductase [Weissella paramesenteroides]